MLFHASCQHPRDIQPQTQRAAAWPPPCMAALWWSRCQRRTGRCAPGTSRAPEWMWLSGRCWGLGRASQKYPLLTKGLIQARHQGTMMNQQMERVEKGRGVAVVTLLILQKHKAHCRNTHLDTWCCIWNQSFPFQCHIRQMFSENLSRVNN